MARNRRGGMMTSVNGLISSESDAAHDRVEPRSSDAPPRPARNPVILNNRLNYRYTKTEGEGSATHILSEPAAAISLQIEHHGSCTPPKARMAGSHDFHELIYLIIGMSPKKCERTHIQSS